MYNFLGECTCLVKGCVPLVGVHHPYHTWWAHGSHDGSSTCTQLHTHFDRELSKPVKEGANVREWTGEGEDEGVCGEGWVWGDGWFDVCPPKPLGEV